MSDVSDEDATRMLVTCPQQSCVSWNLENDTTHGQTGSTSHRSRPPANQSGKRVASWTEESPDTPDILVASSRVCRANLACRRGCYEESASVKFQLKGTRSMPPAVLSYRVCVREREIAPPDFDQRDTICAARDSSQSSCGRLVYCFTYDFRTRSPIRLLTPHRSSTIAFGCSIGCV